MLHRNPPASRDTMKMGLVAILLVASVLAISAAHAGQTNASCEDTPTPPGHADASPGSPFNPAGGTSDEHYAGEEDTPSSEHAQSDHAVSQYDVACAKQPA